MVFLGIRVFYIVTEETKGIKQLIFSKLGRLLKLVGEESLSVVLNNFIRSVFEDFDKLAGQLHNLAGNIRNLSEILLHLFNVLFVDFMVLLLVFNDFLGCHS